MNSPTRLAIFATGLVAAFGAAWGVGTAMSPVLDEAPSHTTTPGGHDDDH